ncbi:MAG: HAD family phosphatase [Ruminococcus sp.]|nr:HAD family phosphatase [Ruminococcus sp.]
MIKGAIFDMDGLMFDTERLVYENWQHIMDEMGLPYDFSVFRQTIGRRKKEVELFYRATYGDDFPYWELAGKCRAMYLRRIEREGIPVKKGLYTILERFRERGVKIALATSTSRHTAALNLRTAGVSDYFDALVCGEDVTNGKPHPEVFLTAAARLGLDPADCAAFEDSINGIKSACAAGMMTVMVPDCLQPTEEIKPMISLLCTSLEEAAAILGDAP